MALTSGEIAHAAALFATDANKGHGTQLVRSAIGATDTWIADNQAAFNAALPEPFKSNATLEQKTLLFCHVAMKRAGIA